MTVRPLSHRGGVGSQAEHRCVSGLRLGRGSQEHGPATRTSFPKGTPHMKSPIPKLARSFAEAVGIARRETSPERIEAALVDARKDVETANAERVAAEAAYRDGLLDASPAESERQLAAASAAKVKVDRAEALVAALTQRLGHARQEQDRARRAAIHADAATKCAAIRERLPAEYRHHAGALRSLLRDLAEAEVARLAAIKEAPDLPAILSPEDEARGALSFPEEIIARETVELWAMEGRAEPLPQEAQGRVQRHPSDPRRGILHPLPVENARPLYGVGGHFHCVLQRFERVRYREAFSPSSSYESLLKAVGLPAFALYGDAYVVPEPFRGADGALAHLAAEMQPAPKIERPVKERFEALPDEPATRETFEVVPFKSSQAKAQGFGGSGYDPTPIRGERRA